MTCNHEWGGVVIPGPVNRIVIDQCESCGELRLPDAAPPAQAVEMSPEFTDTARAAIAWVLWHHQGGSSPVGQPLRFALGMGQHDRMTDHQIAEAKRFAAWAGATTEGFHRRAPAHAVDLGEVRKCADEAVEFINHGYGGHARRKIQELLALIDGKAVGK